MNPVEFLAPPMVLGVIFFGIYSIIKAAQDYRLKKALIEKGANSELISSLLAKSKRDPYPNLRFGLILVALGGALAVGSIFHDGQITAAMMLAFAGVAFLIYFATVRSKSDDSRPISDFMKDLR